MKYKKFLSVSAIILILLSLCLNLSACGNKTSAYAGSYTSVFVDSQSDTKPISFQLTVRKDETFTLIRRSGEAEIHYGGTYKSHTANGETQLLCLIQEGFKWNSKYPNAWNPYFTLSKLDDGTILASPGNTVTSSSTSSAFGWAQITLITLVLFEKD